MKLHEVSFILFTRKCIHEYPNTTTMLYHLEKIERERERETIVGPAWPFFV